MQSHHYLLIAVAVLAGFAANNLYSGNSAFYKFPGNSATS
jgi:hypothetical protein